MTTVKNIYDYINSIAPFDTQESWDNSGFLIGDMKREVRKCVVSLDVTQDVLELSANERADLIVSHHPIIFSKMNSIYSNSAVFKAVQSNVAIIAAHTNFDIADGGINDALAEQLDLSDITKSDNGFLRVGNLPKPMNSSELSLHVKEKLGCNSVRFSASSKVITKIAFCGGAGADFTESAKMLADAYVTGDASYHNFLDASEDDFCLVAAGHFDTEIFGVKALFDKLSALFTDIEFLFANQKNPIEVV